MQPRLDLILLLLHAVSRCHLALPPQHTAQQGCIFWPRLPMHRNPARFNAARFNAAMLQGCQGSKAVSSAGLASLPDDVLLRCLAGLTQQERFTVVSLVSKRFRALCLAPAALRRLHIIVSRPTTAVRTTHALLGFLAVHGQHLHDLSLAFRTLGVPEQQNELPALFAGCLAACGGAAAGLQRLSVRVSCATPVSAAWLPALTALQKLELVWFMCELRLPPGMSRLAALVDAEFGSGGPLRFEAASLPASLTRLCLKCYGYIGGESDEPMPQQLSKLSSLQDLQLHGKLFTPDSVAAVLPALNTLRDLRLLNTSVPAGLTALTNLQSLEADALDAENASGLVAALPALTHLTLLRMNASELRNFPPAIAQLPRLQRLFLLPNTSDPDVEDTTIPRGPWLGSIAWLGLPWCFLEAGVAALSAAPRLAYLCSLNMPALCNNSEWDEFWDFAATHPSLRCLAMDPSETDSWDTAVELVDALLDIRSRQPELQLRRIGRGGTSFLKELQCCVDIPEGSGA